MSKKKNVQYKKIFSRVTLYDLHRLQQIAKDYHFNSVYELNNYLVHCFLRVADPQNDSELEPVPIELKKMFGLKGIRYLIDKMPIQLELFEQNTQKNDIEQTFDDYSNVESPQYGRGQRYRKSNEQIKADRYE